LKCSPGQVKRASVSKGNGDDQMSKLTPPTVNLETATNTGKTSLKLGSQRGPKAFTETTGKAGKKP